MYVYLCLPRAVLVASVPSAELRFTRGFVDQTLAFVGLTLGLYFTEQLIGLPWLRRAVRVAWHVEFAARAGEALLMYVFGMGYSPLVFYHLDPVSIRLALSQCGALLACVALCAVAADWVIRRLPAIEPWRRSTWAERLVICLVLAFAVRSAHMLDRERARLPQDFAAVSLFDNWQAYTATPAAEHVAATPAERREIRTLGIDTDEGAASTPVPPPQRLNLVTIYLEGFQANFTASGHSIYPSLTPNLDQFAARAQVFDHFYNAVTPTINAIISSQCGILSEVENGYLDVDRGYTRNLTCLSDILHQSGYRQVFLGGADSGFSGKRAFLAAHHYDEVDGLEHWRQNPAYSDARLNAWGLQDTDLAREATDRLPGLKAARPFHLSLLTVNTHEPGYVAPDCPMYLPDRVMLNAIHCTDHAVGMLLDALDAQGLMKDTVVIVMGDHMMFPSSDSRAALGPASAGWFGKIFMAIRRPGGEPGTVIGAPSYTPDFAPTALEALGFDPVPAFVVGRPRLHATDAERILVAPRFEVVNGKMNPADPDVADDCTADIVDHIELHSPPGELSGCERDRIMAIVARSLMTPMGRRTD